MPRGAWKHVAAAWLISLLSALTGRSSHPGAETGESLTGHGTSWLHVAAGVFLALILLTLLARLAFRVCRTYVLIPLLAVYSLALFAPFASLYLHHPAAVLAVILVVLSFISVLEPGAGGAAASAAYLLAGTLLYLPLAILLPPLVVFLVFKRDLGRLGAFAGVFLAGVSIAIAWGFMKAPEAGFGLGVITWSGPVLLAGRLASFIRESPSIYLLAAYAPFLLAGLAAGFFGLMREPLEFLTLLAGASLIVLILPSAAQSHMDVTPLIVGTWALFLPAAAAGAVAMTKMFHEKARIAWHLIVTLTFLLPAAVSLVFHQGL